MADKHVSIKTYTAHGMSRTKTYKTWIMMKSRCENHNYDRYADYGGRGIRVCPEWSKSFTAFLRDMGERPEGRSLDRIDTNGDYTKNNCRWATEKEQSRNKRTNRRLRVGDREEALITVCEFFNINRSALVWYLNSHGDNFVEPYLKRRTGDAYGKMLSEWNNSGRESVPVLFSRAGAKCERLGYCPEGERSCGKMEGKRP